VEAPHATHDTQTTVINGGPVAVDDTISRPATGEFKIPTSKLLHNDNDPNGHPLRVVAAGPTSLHNALVTLKGTWIYYNAPDGLTGPDSFRYTITNDVRGSASATVTLTVAPETLAPILNLVGLENNPGGPKIYFAGIPGVAYTIQASSDLVQWQT